MGKTLIIYKPPNGKEPFTEWMRKIKSQNLTSHSRIINRLKRIVEYGTFGDCKHLGERVFEMRFSLGPGYRIYFAQEGDVFVILLCGGDKSSQRKDILKAKAYWREYRERNQ